MSMSNNECCQHVLSVEYYLTNDLEEWKSSGACKDCHFRGPNLWLCLAKDCRRILCGDSHLDHSTTHFQGNRQHCVHQNLSTLRVWCYLCQSEVFLHSQPQQYNNLITVCADENDSTDSDEVYNNENKKPKGLQNIGNTCYMNAALQALCNTPPLSQYFLQCFISNSSHEKKTCLSRNFQRLIQDMWQKNGLNYIVPTGILYGIRSVHPMFRGYQQHDTQEFLRCFMDQLHEELKQPVHDCSCQRTKNSALNNLLQSDLSDDEMCEDNVGDCGASSGSQSEGEYETCDSGVSERSSLSDEGERVSLKRKHSASYQLSARCKLTTRNMQTYKQMKKKKPVRYRSIISDVFDGKLLSSVQCLTCNKVSTRVETFQDLSLPIPSRDHVTMLHQGTIAPQSLTTCSDVYNNKPSWISWLWEWMRSWFWGPTISLHDCLAAFFSADELKGDNMYSCERCSKLRNGVKYSKVLDLPEVLCVHLKRFRHELSFSSKIGSFVSFPLTGLDMRPYLHKDCTSEVTSYDLSSIICHHGFAAGGHYTGYVLSSTTDEWFEVDDETVTPVSPETVTNAEAYVLFYRKNNDKMKKVQSKAVELVRNNKCEPALMQFYVSKEWMNRLNTFAEPGPIDNADFLCKHGGVDVEKIHVVEQMTAILSQTVWQYLYDTFGGGPACNRLYLCGVCQKEQEALRRRTQYELTQYLKLNQEFQQQEQAPSVIYGLSMLWFRQWQNFVQGTANEPPGPIDNSPIITTNNNGVKTLKAGSDYGQLSDELWSFFRNIYGGGPELILKQLHRGQTRTSFSSSGVSTETDSCSSSSNSNNLCSKAKSVESLPVTFQRRVGRTQSTSSDNLSQCKTTHRKHQSLGSVKLSINNQHDDGVDVTTAVASQVRRIDESGVSSVVNIGHCEFANEEDVDCYKPASTPDCDLDLGDVEYCPTLTPEEFYNYTPFNSNGNTKRNKRLHEQ